VLTVTLIAQTVQKDAILRQLKEYKREKQQLEQQVAELEKSSANHDDHLRIIDAWWNQVGISYCLPNCYRLIPIQLIDEVRLLANDIPSQNSGASFLALK
jgi:E3 ubiquitin-protein ligase BRE1